MHRACINVKHNEISCKAAKLPMNKYCANCHQQRLINTAKLFTRIRHEAPELWKQIVKFANKEPHHER